LLHLHHLAFSFCHSFCSSILVPFSHLTWHSSFHCVCFISKYCVTLSVCCLLKNHTWSEVLMSFTHGHLSKGILKLLCMTAVSAVQQCYFRTGTVKA
jgi:uncharacterized membrane protein